MNPVPRPPSGEPDPMGMEEGMTVFTPEGKRR
jgi:hypothetical protein